jgi:hypothetical protein
MSRLICLIYYLDTCPIHLIYYKMRYLEITNKQSVTFSEGAQKLHLLWFTHDSGRWKIWYYD